ncbi:histidine kinase, partial [Enterococcus faecium]
MFPFFKKKPLKLQNTIILVVCFSTFVSLIVSAILIRNFILSMNRSSVSDKISSIAKIVANDKLIQKKLQTGDPTHAIQGITNEIMIASNLDFIVVMDPEGIRYSHADPSYIGLPFSSHEDVKKVIGGQEFFSEKEGMLGFGFRYFVPIYYDQEIIGAVCVGLTNNTIDNQVKDGQKMIVFSLIIGLSVGIIGAVFLAQKMKKVLLGLEPQEIAEQLSEKTIIENEVDEGILAISSDKTILLINTPAKNIFYQTEQLLDFEVGKKISDNLYDVLFKETIEHQT